jgi:hypothetical protein
MHWLPCLRLPLQQQSHNVFHPTGSIATGCIACQRIDDLERHHLPLGALVNDRVQRHQRGIDKQLVCSYHIGKSLFHTPEIQSAAD